MFSSMFEHPLRHIRKLVFDGMSEVAHSVLRYIL